MRKVPLCFSIPGVGEGVGFLISYGGIPQFSIAFDCNMAPERMSIREATERKVLVEGLPMDRYFVIEPGSNDPKLQKLPPADSEGVAMESNPEDTPDVTNPPSSDASPLPPVTDPAIPDSAPTAQPETPNQ